MAALYQQARPITFDQVIGQEHVKDLLVAALQKGRIGHAYLFSGPRGVGKTTTARLLAMAVNCSNEKIKPCGECESCMLVRQAGHPDVIELDAASNNSVEDIRDLREKVNLASIRGGSRVWILDEAHMLTKSAANALLKTLEEPPSNLVFILATTEPEKLPATILSRCQHYRFRRLSEAEIGGKLQGLCDNAKIEAEPEAIALIARAADGAMRDGESLLERLLSQEKAITRQDAEEALGLPPQERIEALAGHLMGGKLDALFSEASALYRDGFAPRTLAERLKMSLRDAVYTQLKLEGYNFELKNSEKDILKVIHALDEENERFTRYNDLFSLEVALIKAHNTLNDNEPGAGTVVITQGNPSGPQPTAVAQPAGRQALPDFNPTNSSNQPAARAQAQPPTTPNQAPPQQSQTAAASTSGKTANWNDVKKRANAQLKAFLMPGQVKIEGSIITISFPEARHTFHFGQLKSRRDELRELVDDVLGKGYTLQLEGSGGNLTLKPDAADAAAGVSPQIVQEEAPTQPQPQAQPHAQPQNQAQMQATSSSTDAAEAGTPLITTVNIEASSEVPTSDTSSTSTNPKRSIKAPDTVPDDLQGVAKAADLATEIEEIKQSLKSDSKKEAKKLIAIPENDVIKLDDLGEDLPNTETENEALSGDFWGEDSGSVAPVAPIKASVPPAKEAKKVQEQPTKSQEVKPQEIDTEVTKTQVIETQVVETKVINAAPVENSAHEKTQAKSIQTPKEVVLVAAKQVTDTNEDDAELDDSEVAIKDRLEHLQVLFPGHMSLVETFDKSDESDESEIEDSDDRSLESSETDSE